MIPDQVTQEREALLAELRSSEPLTADEPSSVYATPPNRSAATCACGSARTAWICPTCGTHPPHLTGQRRWGTSCHEAGHAVISIRLGRPIAVVSIKPGLSHGGVMIPEAADYVEDWNGPLVSWDTTMLTDMRDRLEVGIVVTMAGEAAAELLAPASGYPSPEAIDDEEAALRAAESLARLPTVAAERLEVAVRDPESIPDAVAAARAAHALTQDDEAAHFLVGFLRAIARAQVRRHAKEIHAVATELHRRESMTGDEVTEVMRSATRPPRRLAEGAVATSETRVDGGGRAG